MTRATRALIDLAALRHNFQLARKTAPASRLMAVIKANAYGHGVIPVARALEDSADAFAVANLHEGLQLREGGCRLPIVLLQGCQTGEEFALAARLGLQPVIHQAEQIGLLASAHLPESLSLWLKLDTGMHRLGVSLEDFHKLHQRLSALASATAVNLMTHFANADERDDPLTDTQIRRFKATTGQLPGARSLANSAGLLAWPASHADWVRPGIMLYGISPFRGVLPDELGLRPVMSLRSRLLAVNHYRRGTAIGYGGRYVCEEDMPIGVVGIGYGDGYPRHAPDGTPVLVNGQRVPLAGRVSMDMLTVDLRRQPQAAAGDEVILWGADLPVDEVAQQAGTIGYELVCRLTRRVAFDYAD